MTQHKYLRPGIYWSSVSGGSSPLGKVEENGVYIIKDPECSVWRYYRNIFTRGFGKLDTTKNKYYKAALEREDLKLIVPLEVTGL